MFSTISKTFLPHLVKNGRLVTAKMSSTPNYETLSVTVPKEYVYHVQLNRPEQLNAMNNKLWVELGNCFQDLDSNEDCRVVILSGNGKIFTAGLDFKGVMDMANELADKDDIARKAKVIYKYIKTYQNSISSLELCRKPVLAAIHSACVGGGVDLITATDMRYCSKDAWFQVKEVDIGMAADVGTLQRLPKIIGSQSLVRELCFTARKFNAAEALGCGLVSKVYEDKDSMINGVVAIAEEISRKSPVAVQGTKVSLIYSRDHTVQESLDHIGLWNQLMLQSEDFATATMGQIAKNKDVKFSKL